MMDKLLYTSSVDISDCEASSARKKIKIDKSVVYGAGVCDDDSDE